MVRIEVVAYNGKPPGAEFVADFDELGGSIGRDPACTLVLPDPEKRISRRHAAIVLRDGRYVLRDQGSAMPALLNGRPIGPGHEVPLADGDRIEIGGYALRVTFPPAAPRQDEPRASQPGTAPERSGGEDLLSMFGAGAPSRDPFADLAPKPSRGLPPTPAEQVPSPRPEVRREPEGAIPPDFDPFAEPFEPPRAAPPSRPTDALGLPLEPPGKSGSIDELFGLGPGGREEPFPPGHPLAAGRAGEGEPGVDALLSSRRAAAPREAPQRDDVAELHGSMKLPEGKEAPPPVPHAPPGSVVSWDQPAGGEPREVKTVVIPSPTERVPQPEPAAEPRVEVRIQAELPAARRPREPEVRPAAAAQAEAAAPDALLKAFLEGAGVPDVPLRGPLTPELMRYLGLLFRTATQGTLDLLRSRAVVKSELHAQVTVIVSRENNPLKFSPTVEAALHHLLAPSGHGFMTPVRAMQEAYQDLVAHQLGIAAGMRAALAGVLARFDPAEVEKRLTEASVIDSLLPGHRKARLWDLYGERFAELSGEAEEDFHRVFGREFLKAYEAQVTELKKQGGPGDR